MTIDDAATFDFDSFVKDFIRSEGLRGCHVDISGVVSIERWNKIVDEYTKEFNEKRYGFVQKQEQNPSEIYRVVKELRLNPFNPGHNEYSWYANCPGGHHSLMFSTKSTEWGCGYCKVKGGPHDLREFYKNSLHKLVG